MNARTNSHLHVAVLNAVVDGSRQWGPLRLDVTYPSQPHSAVARHHHLGNAVRVLIEVHLLVVGKSVRSGGRGRRSIRNACTMQERLFDGLRRQVEAALLHVAHNILRLMEFQKQYHYCVFEEGRARVGVVDSLDVGDDSLHDLLLQEAVRSHLDLL